MFRINILKIHDKKNKDKKDNNYKNSKDDESKELSRKINELNTILLKSNILEIAVLIGNKKQLLLRNFMAGIARGIGIGIGVTIITSLLVFILQKIVTLNIPIIGEYITDIVDIVMKSKY